MYEVSFYDYIQQHNIVSVPDYKLGVCKTTMIQIDDNVTGGRDTVRRPYYRLRGKNVTREQALNIIGKTDEFFSGNVLYQLDTAVPSINFCNWLIADNHVPKNYGWCHVDGTIGVNSIMGKYPSIAEVVEEWGRYAVEFPYLDLIACVTDWDECPPELHGKPDVEFYDRNWDTKFYDSVRYGVHVKNGVVRIIGKPEAIGIYHIYNKDNIVQRVFEPDYYTDNGIMQVNYDTLVYMASLHSEHPETLLRDLCKLSSLELRWTIRGLLGIKE